MDYSNLIYMLESHGKKCLELAKRMHPDGSTEMNAEEKKMLRLALVPAVQESCDIIQSAFVLDQKEWMNTELKRLHEFLEIGSS